MSKTNTMKFNTINFSLHNIRDWYSRYERPVSSASLIGGFIFDALTLKRVDLFWENIWVIAHFLVIAFFIVLINLQENESLNEKDATKAHFWYINILQFFFGGLLSTFLVFYYRSSTLVDTWPFLLLLSIAFIANESLKKHYARLTFQISFFFLSLMAFSIFIIPVIFHRIGSDIFLISGAISLLILFLFLLGLKFITKEKFYQSKKIICLSIGSIYLTTNILYFANLIPPIPLSLKEAGVYHSITRNKTGNYIVQSEQKNLSDYFAWQENFHTTKEDTAYAYSAVFSPALFNTEIIHNWQKYNQKTKQWTTISRVKLSTTGGRDNGYRTYSRIKITPGIWRVNIETSTSQLIGRLRFNAIQINIKPELITKTLN